MYSVGKTLPFSHAAPRALTVVIDNYIYGCMVFLFVVRLAALILLEVLLILLPLDFFPLTCRKESKLFAQRVAAESPPKSHIFFSQLQKMF